MIRKPDDREFKERATVSAIRDARTLAVEGARGVGKGTANLVKWWLMLLFGFGFVMSVLSSLGAVWWLLAMAGGVAWYLTSRKKRSDREAAYTARPRVERVADPGLTSVADHHDVSVAVIGGTVAKIAVPAILLFPTSGMFTFMAPFTLVGVVALALAILLLARLTGDRAILRYDGRTLTVRGLLGEGTMMWADVDDIVMRKTSIFNLATLFTSGARRNIVVTAMRNRMDGPTRLLIPYPLIGLDQEDLVTLMTKLLMLQSGGPDLVVAAVNTPGNALSSSAAQAAGEPFDPDKIMARYLAEREEVIATARPANVASGPVRTFGRKKAAVGR